MRPPRPLLTALPLACALALLQAPAGAAPQPPAEPFVEELEVREVSLAAVPRGGGEPPTPEELTIAVNGLEQRVTRIERLSDGERGDWRFVVWLDPELAGARTRYLTALALGQRAEVLAALGTVEVLVAEGERPVLEPTGDWQRIEAALFDRALAARRKLERGEPALARPDWPHFYERLELLAAALAGRGAGSRRALLVPSDGVDTAPDSDALAALARRLAGAGWITVPMPWSELPAEESAARLSEFERWREGAEGRNVGVGQRRYVIDFGRVVRRLRGAPAAAAETALELDPRLEALEQVASPTSGRLASGDGELEAVLAELARRWRIWFELRVPRTEGPWRVEARLGDEPLAAPAWLAVE